MKISFRIGNTTTSITLRNDIVSLWILFTGRINHEDYYNDIQDYISKMLDLWKEDNARGFSKFIMKNMISDILEDSDRSDYIAIKKKLN